MPNKMKPEEPMIRRIVKAHLNKSERFSKGKISINKETRSPSKPKQIRKAPQNQDRTLTYFPTFLPWRNLKKNVSKDK